MDQPQTDSPREPGLLAALLPLAILAAGAAFAVYRLDPPAPVGIDAPPTEFSADRAFEIVRVMAKAVHPVGTDAHEEVRLYVLEEMKKLGLDPQVQETDLRECLPDRPGVLRNLLARIEGADNTKALLLAAHYDSAEKSFGAGDDGAGVAALLEAVRALRASGPLRNTLILLIDDGEEIGLCGAIAFAKHHPWFKDVGLVLNFEARGTAGPSMMFETSDGNGRLIAEYAAVASHPSTTSLSGEVYRRMPNRTDLTVFRAAGLAGLNFAFIENVKYYHTAGDNLEHLDRRSLQHHGDNALAMARRFGNLDLRDLGAPDAIHFDVLNAFVVRYPATWAISFLVLALAAFVGTAWLGFRRGALTLRRCALGVVAWMLLLGAIPLVAYGVLLLVRVLHPIPGYWVAMEFGTRPDLHSGLFLLSLALFTAGLRFAARRTGLGNAAFGGALVWLLLAAVTGVGVAGASYLFTWPTVFGLAGAALAFAGKDRMTRTPGAIAALALFGLPLVFLMAPTIHSVFVAMSFRWAPVLALLHVLALAPAAPFLIALPKTAARVGIGISAAAGIAFLALATLTA